MTKQNSVRFKNPLNDTESKSFHSASSPNQSVQSTSMDPVDEVSNPMGRVSGNTTAKKG